MTSTLLDLAKKLDGLDPTTAWKERLEIAEQMKEKLGARQADFEQCYDALLAPARVELTGRKEGDEVMLLLPSGPIREIVLTAEDPKAKVRLTSLFHGAWNLLHKKVPNGVSVPGRLPLACDFIDCASTVMAFQSDGPASVGVLFVRSNPAEAALRILAARMAAEDAPEAPTGDTAPAPAKGGAPAAPAPLETVAGWLERVEEAKDNGEPTDWHSALGSLAESMREVLGLGPAPAPEAPPLTEEDRIAQAAAAYRRYKTLSLQAQVQKAELKEASLSWQAERDTFDKDAQGLLDKATRRIDQEIAEERRRPAQHPNQLPGAIRRAPEAKK